MQSCTVRKSIKKNVSFLGVEDLGEPGDGTVQWTSRSRIDERMSRPRFNREIKLLQLTFWLDHCQQTLTIYYSTVEKNLKFRLRKENDSPHEFHIWGGGEQPNIKYLSPPTSSWKEWIKGNPWLENFVEKYGVFVLEGFFLNFLRYDPEHDSFNRTTYYPVADEHIDNIKKVLN